MVMVRKRKIIEVKD